jgi:PII-like signaling protein
MENRHFHNKAIITITMETIFISTYAGVTLHHGALGLTHRKQ